jgi:hypothetical protein
MEQLQIHTKFQFETLKGRDTLGDLDLDAMLKKMRWTAQKELQFQLPFVQ